MRGCSCGRLARWWPNGQEGAGSVNKQASRRRPSILLDDALPAGSLEAAAELRRFIRRRERANHGAVVHALFAEVGALDHRLPRSQHRWELALQGPERTLRIGL